MTEITTVGLDLAKQVFHVVCCDARGKVVGKRMLRRAQVLNYFANLTPVLVGLEACAGAHYWARELKALGHRVKVLPPRAVKAFVQGNKNDYNDALAIAEAAVRPEMRGVAVKTVAQQDVQALHRLRSQCVASRTALGNQLRGLLAEYGLVLPPGLSALRRRVPELLEDDENGLSDAFRRLLAQGCRQLVDLDEHIAAYGPDNHLRLTGLHETQSIDQFSYGVSDRGASIRIPVGTVDDGWKGRLEDRRPASNGDPYKIAGRIIQTVKSADIKDLV